MKNYKDSDYALNKHSEGIVYRFADGRKETIWLEDYLSANPSKTAEDFAALKALSDEIYHEQVVVEHRTGRLDVSINGLEETAQLSVASLDVELLHKKDTDKALRAAHLLLQSGKLTKIQQRRFILHFFQGFSTRQIGAREGVSHIAVYKSICFAKEKLKTFFEEQG